MLSAILRKRFFRIYLGRVADFCPMCRDFTPSALVHVRVARILEYMGGGGRTVEHVRVCEACETELPADPSHYTQPATNPDASADDLLLRTHPEALQRWSERLAMEERGIDGCANAEERRTLLAEPFFALARPFEMARLFGSTTPRANKTLVCVLAAVLIGAQWAARQQTFLAIGIGAALVVLVCALAAILIAAPSRFARHELEPRLAATLAPLRPTVDELTSVCTELRSDGVRLAGAVSPARIEAAIRTRLSAESLASPDRVSGSRRLAS